MIELDCPGTCRFTHTTLAFISLVKFFHFAPLITTPSTIDYDPNSPPEKWTLLSYWNWRARSDLLLSANTDP